MKTRKGEPVIVVPEEQQQIVELERQLAAERKQRVEAEAERDALYRKATDEVWYWQGDGYDMPESLTCPVLMDADTLRDLLEKVAERNRLRQACIQTEREVQQTLGQALGYPWCKDDQMAFPGSTEADGVCVGEHTAETLAMEIAERLKKAEVELRRWRGCPSCKEDHDDSVMCPPHEVRTSGRAWFHTQARKWAERTEEVEAQLAAIDRVLEEGEITTVGASFANTADAIRETIAALRQAEKERDDWQAEALANRGAEEAADELRAQAVQNANTALREKYALMAVLLLLPGWDKEATVEENWTRLIAERNLLLEANEFIKNEAAEWRAERDQLAAECGLLREALETFKNSVLKHTSNIQIEIRKGAVFENVMLALASRIALDGAFPEAALLSTPHAAKAAERMRKLEAVAKTARHFYGHYGPLNDALDRLDALDKPEGNNGSV